MGLIDGTIRPLELSSRFRLRLVEIWMDYYIRGRKATAELMQAVKATISQTVEGDYRLVQTSTPAKYTLPTKVFKPNPAFTTSGSLNARRGTFSIQARRSQDSRQLFHNTRLRKP